MEGLRLVAVEKLDAVPLQSDAAKLGADTVSCEQKTVLTAFFNDVCCRSMFGLCAKKLRQRRRSNLHPASMC